MALEKNSCLHDLETSCKIVAHLDEPCNPSTRLSEKVYFKGWFVAPSGLSASSLKSEVVKLLIEPKQHSNTAARANCKLTSQILSHSSSFTCPFIETIDVVENKHASDSSDSLVGESRYAVSGVINVASLIPPDNAQASQFLLTMSVALNRDISVSNSVEMQIVSRNLWNVPYGGFLFPSSGILCSDFIVVQGWALCQGDKLSAVELSMNDVSVGCAEIGLWSPGIHLSLPDPEESRQAFFAKALVRKDIVRKLGGSGLSGAISIKARCEFLSGQKHEFSLSEVLWRKYEHKGSGLSGEIEKVALSADGMLAIEGWVFNQSGWPVQLYMEAVRKRESIVNAPEKGRLLRFFSRPEIEQKYLPDSLSSKNGFEIKINPALFGRFGGQIRLVAESEQCVTRSYIQGNVAAKCFRQDWAWSRISRAVKDCASYRNVGLKVLSNFVYIGSSLGLRKSFHRRLSKRSLNVDSRTNNPRLIFATHNLSSVEGAPKVLFRIVESLCRESALSPEVLIISACEGPGRESYEQLGVEVHVIEGLSASAQSFERYYESTLSAAELIFQFKPSLVFANVIDSFWGIDIANRLGIASIWMIHESVKPLAAFGDMDPRLRVKFLHLISRAKRTVFVAKSSRALYAEFLDESEVEVIPNGIDAQEIEQKVLKHTRSDARKALRIAEDEKVISIVGTTAYHKGQDVFIREMALLKALMPNEKFKFLIVGTREGDYLEELHEMARGLPLSEELEFVAATTDVAPYYCASDVMVVASREESAPLVSLEAFAYGVVLVSTAVFGLAEQITDGVNARVFDSQNVGELASCVQEVLQDDAQRERLVRNAKDIVMNKFSLRDSLSKHVDVLTKVLEENIS